MLKSIWKDPVWSVVIASGILAVTGAIGTYLLDLWPAIGIWLSGIWERAREPSQISNWKIWLMALLVLPTLVALIASVWAVIRPSQGGQYGDWRTYKEDEFLGLRWRWTYFPSGTLEHPIPFCPNCDYQVFPHQASAFRAIDRIGFHCDSCGQNLPEFDESFESLRSKIERFVQQNIRTGGWKRDTQG